MATKDTEQFADVVRTNIGKLYAAGDGPSVREVLEAIPNNWAKIGGQWVEITQECPSCGHDEDQHDRDPRTGDRYCTRSLNWEERPSCAVCRANIDRLEETHLRDPIPEATPLRGPTSGSEVE